MSDSGEEEEHTGAPLTTRECIPIDKTRFRNQINFTTRNRCLIPDGGADQSADEVDHQFDDCPTCGGELQYQTDADAECLNCGEVFCHEIRADRHLLWDYDDLGWMRGVVARVE